MRDLSVLETIHELYISLTVMMFDIALLIVVVMQGGARKENGNRRFFNALLSVTGATIFSCMSFFFQHADIDAPMRVRLFFHLVSYMANIVVAFFLTVYIGGFFSADALGNRMRKINRRLLVIPAVIMVVYYILQVPKFSVPGADVFAHGWFRALVGYLFELYYMCFCLTYIGKGDALNRRAKRTIIVAFVMTLISFAMQLALGARPLVNFVGASLAFLLFYFSAETPDYRKLQKTLAELQAEKQAAEEARLQADKANRAKSEFLAEMSREVFTPVHTVCNMSERIMRESAEEQIRALAAQADRAGRELLSIMNDTLDFSAPESGAIRLVKKNESPGVPEEKTDGEEHVISPEEALARIRKETPLLQRACEELLAGFLTSLNNDEAPAGEDGGETLSPEEIAEIRDGIREFAESYDADSIMRLLEQAYQSRLTGEERTAFRRLEALVKSGDWEELQKPPSA